MEWWDVGDEWNGDVIGGSLLPLNLPLDTLLLSCSSFSGRSRTDELAGLVLLPYSARPAEGCSRRDDARNHLRLALLPIELARPKITGE